MKKIIFLLFFIVLITIPVFAFASNCSDNGTTVVFVNGVFSDEASAQVDKDLLKKDFKNITKRSDVEFINGFNPSHLSGLGDLIKSTEQAYGNNALDYDLTNILTQIHSELSTRKVLLVGHSQGTFYTNTIFDYLVKNGVPQESIAVYNIATPADKVAGDGNYLTSSTDKVINSIVRRLAEIGSAKKPLPANINIQLTPEQEKDPLGGHSLTEVYLKSVPDKIVGDMQEEINNLSSDNNKVLSSSGCFTAPQITLAHQISGLGFLLGDNVFRAIGSKKNAPFVTTDLAKEFFKIGLQKVSYGLSSVYNFGKNLNLSKLFGASLISGVEQFPSDELISSDIPQGTSQDIHQPQDIKIGQIIETNNQNPIQSNLDDKQDKIDDILEKIDILRQQIAKLSGEGNANDNSNQSDDKNEETNQTDTQEQKENNFPIILTGNGDGGSGGGGGGGSSTVYPKVLISEVQISGLTDEKEEFVELYNPNIAEIDLTNWYLQKKTKTGSSYSTFVSNTLFSGKKIGANSYFVIARENSSFVGLADIITNNSLTEDNSLILKNPNGEISDKLGFGQAQEYEISPALNPEKGQSIGRKWDETNNIEQDTDNNSTDFEAQTPTPKTKNITFVLPPDNPPQPPKDEIAPEVSFSLNAIQTSLTFTINFDITDPITTVSPSGIESYIFRWQKQGDSWQEDGSVNVNNNPATVSVEREFTGQDETTYSFQVKTKDKAGNESDWQPETPAETRISVFKKVLINEIQIDSVVGAGGTDDDWVELYNPNDAPVPLNGWSIQKHSPDDPCSIDKSFYKKNFSADAVILPKGFFLIADTNANDTLKTLADMTIGWSLTQDNTIYLSQSQDKITDGADDNIIDKVGFGSACFPETSPAQNPPEAKSIERVKLGQDTDNNSTDFKISDESTPKAGSPKSHIWDGTGDVAEGSPPNYLNSMSGSGNVNYYNVKIKWNSNSPNLDFYDVQYKVNNGAWQDWAIKTQDTEKIYQAYNSMLADYVYQFRVRAQDKDGNQGDWSEVTVDVANPVVINEIALYGTNVSRDDIWIELYNKSDMAVDLTGWKILLHSGFYHELVGTIPAKGYFVLESDDSNISDVLADQIFVGSISGRMPLTNQNNRQMDQVYLPNDRGSYGWTESAFLKDENYHSVERISPYASGNNIANWRINNDITTNGTDKDGNIIYGTPGQQNSNYQIYTPLTSDFAENTTLSLSLSPYLISWNRLSVYKDKTLAIEPGAIIKFYNSYGLAGLMIEGTLNAMGTADKKIIFTSFFDDEYGGDIDGHSPQVDPSVGNWVGLQFTKDATDLSKLDNIILRYAGYNIADLGGSGIRVDQVSISLKNSIIEKNLQSGVLLLNSSSTIDTVNFLDNEIVPGYYPHDGNGVYVQGGSPQIANSYFKGNVYGVKMQSWWNSENKEFQPYPTVDNNNFEQNTNPIYVGTNSHPTFANNQATGNELNAIVIEGDINSDTTWQKDLVYVIRSGGTIYQDAILTINPGVIVKFYNEDRGMGIRGTLKAIGTPDEPIIFTALKDDEFGGDTNQDADASSPQPGSWLGLYFSKDATNLSELDNAVVRYGGKVLGSSFGAGIKADQVAISLSNSVIEKNKNNGLWLANSPSIIDSSYFQDQTDIEEKGIYVQGGNSDLIIKNSNISNNYYGIYVTTWPDVDNAIFWVNFYVNNNTVSGNAKENVWDTENPPPGP